MIQVFFSGHSQEQRFLARHDRPTSCDWARDPIEKISGAFAMVELERHFRCQEGTEYVYTFPKPASSHSSSCSCYVFHNFVGCTLRDNSHDQPTLTANPLYDLPLDGVVVPPLKPGVPRGFRSYTPRWEVYHVKSGQCSSFWIVRTGLRCRMTGSVTN